MATRHRVKLPQLGDGVDTVVVVEWHVSAGAEIRADDPLVTVETDKVDTEMPSPLSGKVMEILALPGAELAVGDPLCVIEA